MQATGDTRDERLVARVTESDKKLFDHAASLAGTSTSSFMVSTLRAAARRVIDEHEKMRLSQHDRETFVQALFEDAEPNAALRAAARDYRERNR